MAATYSKPTKIPRWADTGTRTEPSSGKKDAGWIYQEAPPYGWENWLQGISGDWFKWIDERFFDGATKDDLLIKHPGTAEDRIRLGGTVNTIYGQTQNSWTGVGGSEENGFEGIARNTGAGGHFTGSGSASSYGVYADGAGILAGFFEGTGTNGAGIEAEANGTGTAGKFTGGATGFAIEATTSHSTTASFTSTATNGTAVKGEAQGTGSGIYGISGDGANSKGVYGLANYTGTYAGWFDGNAQNANGILAQSAGDGVAALLQAVSYHALKLEQSDSTPTKGILNIEDPGVNPSSPDDGDIWYNSPHLYFRDSSKNQRLNSVYASLETDGASGVTIGNEVGVSTASTTTTYIQVNFDVSFGDDDFVAIGCLNSNSDIVITVEKHSGGDYVRIIGRDMSSDLIINWNGTADKVSLYCNGH